MWVKKESVFGLRCTSLRMHNFLSFCALFVRLASLTKANKLLITFRANRLQDYRCQMSKERAGCASYRSDDLPVELWTVTDHRTYCMRVLDQINA